MLVSSSKWTNNTILWERYCHWTLSSAWAILFSSTIILGHHLAIRVELNTMCYFKGSILLPASTCIFNYVNVLKKCFLLILANGNTTAYHLASRQVPGVKPTPPQSVSYMKFMMNWSTQRPDCDFNVILLGKRACCVGRKGGKTNLLF